MVERWTRERRLEHTRWLLLDAAEDVFAERASRQLLSMTLPTRRGTPRARSTSISLRRKTFWPSATGTGGAISTTSPMSCRRRSRSGRANSTRSQRGGANSAATGCRACRAGARVHPVPPSQPRRPRAGGREKVRGRRGTRDVIVEGIDRIGGTLLIPPLTFAQVLVATSDSVVLSSELDDVDLYRPIVAMYTSAIKLP